MATSKSASSKQRKRSTGGSSNGSSATAKSSRGSSARAKSNRSPSTRAKGSRGSSSGSRSRSNASKGNPVEQAVGTAKETAASAKDTAAKATGPALGAAKQVASKAKGPALAAGVAAAGVAGGWAAARAKGPKHHGLGALLPQRRRRVLGVPLRRKSNAVRAAEALRDGAKHLSAASHDASSATGDVRRVGAQLEQVNRQSPLEVVLDGLTRRRG